MGGTCSNRLVLAIEALWQLPSRESINHLQTEFT
jgi:hypothetical protein